MHDMIAQYFKNHPEKWDVEHADYIKEYQNEFLREVVYMLEKDEGISWLVGGFWPGDVDELANILKNIDKLPLMLDINRNTLGAKVLCQVLNGLLFYKIYEHDNPTLLLSYMQFVTANEKESDYLDLCDFMYYGLSPLPYKKGDNFTYLSDISNFGVRIDVSLYLMLLFKSIKCAKTISEHKSFAENNGIITPAIDYLYDNNELGHAIQNIETLLFVRAFLESCRDISGIRIILECSKYIDWVNHEFLDAVMDILEHQVPKIIHHNKGIIPYENYFYYILHPTEIVVSDWFDEEGFGVICDDRQNYEKLRPIWELHIADHHTWTDKIKDDGVEKSIDISDWFDDVDKFVVEKLKQNGLNFLRQMIMADTNEGIEENIRNLMNAIPKSRRKRV
jgi:hypothetical protein